MHFGQNSGPETFQRAMEALSESVLWQIALISLDVSVIF